MLVLVVIALVVGYTALAGFVVLLFLHIPRSISPGSPLNCPPLSASVLAAELDQAAQKETPVLS